MKTCLIIIIIFVLLFLINNMCKKKSSSPSPSIKSNFGKSNFGKSNFNKGSEYSSPNDTKVDNINSDSVLIFYANWCGHCKKSMPEFIKVNKMNDKIILIDSDEYPDLIKKYKVNGFPTIMKANGEKYSGDRESKSISDFADS